MARFLAKLCNFTKGPNGLFRCTNAGCGYVLRVKMDKPPHRSCPHIRAINIPDLQPIAERLAEETGDPSILTKTAHYSAALFRWSLAGFPTRSKEEVARIYTEHCQPCKKFDPEAGACTFCGCPVKAEGMAIGNKAAMGTEECPLGKW